MKTVTFTDFRKNASELLNLVEEGETLQISRHGKPIARVVPADTPDHAQERRHPGLRLRIPGVSLSQAILDEREESM